MGSHIVQFIKLFDFKSFAGQVTIGPLQNFTVLVGSNAAGKHDLMDAVDFVFGCDTTGDEDANQQAQQQPSSKRRRRTDATDPTLPGDQQAAQPSAVLATVIRCDSDTVVHLKRTRRRSTPNAGDTYEINHIVVTPAAYTDKLLQLNLRPPSSSSPSSAAPVLEPHRLLHLFTATAMQRLRLFEQVCGSAEFAPAVRTLSTRLAAAEAERHRDRQLLTLVAQTQRTARQRAITYTELELQAKRLRLQLYHWDLRALAFDVDESGAELRSARQQLLKVDAAIGQHQRAERECRRRRTQSQMDAAAEDGQDEATADDVSGLLPERRVAVFQQKWHWLQQIDRFIGGQIEALEAASEEEMEGEEADWWTDEYQEAERQFGEYHRLAATLPHPGQRTHTQQTIAEQLRTAFNEDLNRKCAAFNEAMNKPPSRMPDDWRRHFADTRNELQQLCDADSDRRVAELLQQPACTIRHPFGVLGEIADREVAGICRTAMVGLQSAVICDSAVAAELAATILQSNDDDDDEDDGIEWHGIRTLLVHAANGGASRETSGMPEMPVMEGVRCHFLWDVVGATSAAEELGLTRYVGRCMPTLLCSGDWRRARELAGAVRGVRVVSADDVVFGWCGDVCLLVGTVDQNGCTAGLQQVLQKVMLNAIEYAFDLNAICNGLADAEFEAGWLDAMMEYFESDRLALARMLNDRDRAAVRTEMLAARESNGAEMQSANTKMHKLKRESLRRVSVAVLADLDAELCNIEHDISNLLLTRTQRASSLEHCKSAHDTRRLDLHSLLLRLMRKQVPIPLRTGHLHDISASNLDTLDAVQIDFSAIDAQLPQPTATEARRQRDHIQQQLNAVTALIEIRLADRSVAAIHAQLRQERDDLERRLKRADRRVRRLSDLLADQQQRRLQRLRPFYRHMKRALAEKYAQAYGGSRGGAAEASLLPESMRDDAGVAEVFASGVHLAFRPPGPGPSVRPKRAMQAGDRLLAALVGQFAVYAYARQPFVFVADGLDGMMAGAGSVERRLVAEFLAMESVRTQVVVCTERPDMFGCCDKMIGVLVTPDLKSQVVDYTDDADMDE